MIAPGPSTRVFLALGATDMRKGFDGLFGLVQSKLQADPLSGHLFVFANAARNRLKVFYWDGSGMWVCSKRLERGRYRWPEATGKDGRVELSAAECPATITICHQRQLKMTPDDNYPKGAIEGGFAMFRVG